MLKFLGITTNVTLLLLTLRLLTLTTSISAAPYPYSAETKKTSVNNDPASNAISVLLLKNQTILKITALTGNLIVTSAATDSQTITKDALLLPDKDAGKIKLNGVSVKAPVFLQGTNLTSSLRLQTEIFHGILQIWLDNGTLTVVNWLPLETYIIGTVNKEMHPSWEMAALKAQAVASRSYAMYMRLHPRHHWYDVTRDITDQVYAGAKEASGKVIRAVKETTGQYLIDNNSPLKAHFHSMCGGFTESASSVWGNGDSVSKPILCPYCSKHLYVWKSIMKINEVFFKLKIPWHNSDRLQLFSFSHSPSGRIQKISAITKLVKKQFNANEFREKLGYSRLKSARFTWRVNRETIEFEGRGLGHGVGLCQWGAREMAQQHKTYKEILSHYYPGHSIANLN